MKRRRDQQPTDSLCIVEDGDLPVSKRTVPALEDALAALRTSSAADDAPGQTGSASTNAAIQQQQQRALLGHKRLVLRRVNTVNSTTDGTGSDTAVLSSKRRRGSSMDNAAVTEELGMTHHTSGSNANSGSSDSSSSNLWVTRGKKLLRGNDGASFVVVDLSMESAATSTNRSLSGPITSAAAPAAVPAQPSRLKLVNPPTRKLQTALDTCFAIPKSSESAPPLTPPQVSSLLGDMLDALTMGADVNFARPLGGQTALMMASTYASTRAAERVLARGADVFATDAQGRTALDYVCGLKGCAAPYSVATGAASRANIEAFVLHLNRAATKQRPQNAFLDGVKLPDMRDSGSAALEGEGVKGGGEEDAGEGYVFDIFCADTQGLFAETAAGHSSHPQDPVSTSVSSAAHATSHAPIVQVEGLRLGAAGQAELVFAYDSDWSDLGDDEDPDSNDERFAGNDYPEGEETEDEAWYAGADDESIDQEAVGREGQRKGYRRRPVHAGDSSESSDNSDNSDAGCKEKGRLRRAAASASAFASASSAKAAPVKAAAAGPVGRDSGKKGSISDILGSDYIRGNPFFDNDADLAGANEEEEEDDEEDDEEDEEGDEEEEDLGGGGGGGMSLQDDYGGRFAQQLNRGTGRVQRPIYADDDERGQDAMSAEALRELWDTSGGDHAEAAAAEAAAAQRVDWGANSSAREHRDRILAMRNKSGMHVGALAREFTKSGLVKYGAELSSDEDDENILLQGMYTDPRAGVAGGAGRPQAMPIETHGMGIFALGRGVGERARGLGTVKWQASAGASASAGAGAGENAPYAYDPDRDGED